MSLGAAPCRFSLEFTWKLGVMGRSEKQRVWLTVWARSLTRSVTLWKSLIFAGLPFLFFDSYDEMFQQNDIRL